MDESGSACHGRGAGAPRALVFFVVVASAALLSCKAPATSPPGTTSPAGVAASDERPGSEPTKPEPEPKPGAWATTIGPVGVQRVEAMVVDAEGTTHVLAPLVRDCKEPAGRCGSLFTELQSLIAHDRHGRLLHTHHLELADGWVDAMTSMPDGRLALLSRPNASAANTPPASRPTRIRLVERASGEVVQSITLDLEAEPGPSHMVATADGDFVVAGTFIGRLRIGAHAVKASSDEEDVFVARFDASGKPRWHVTARGHTPGLSGQDTLRALEVLSDGDVAIAGGCRGRPLSFTDGRRSESIRCGGRKRDDAYVARIGPDGTLRWVRHLWSTTSGSKWIGLGAVPVALAEAPNHGLVVAGLFSHVLELRVGDTKRTLFGRGFSDTFVAHYDAAGTLVDAWQIGGPGQDRMWDLVVEGEDAWLAGTVAGQAALADLRPSKAFVDHDPESLHLPALGVLVRVRLVDGSHAHAMLGADAEWLLVAPDGLRLAGSFGDDTASFPFGDGGSTVLLRRLPPEQTYESFLWAPPWDALQPGRLLPRGEH
jgi:hypothetical protein